MKQTIRIGSKNIGSIKKTRSKNNGKLKSKAIKQYI